MYVPPALLVGEVMQTFHDLSQSTQTRESLLQFDDLTVPVTVENVMPIINSVYRTAASANPWYRDFAKDR